MEMIEIDYCGPRRKQRRRATVIAGSAGFMGSHQIPLEASLIPGQMTMRDVEIMWRSIERNNRQERRARREQELAQYGPITRVMLRLADKICPFR